MSAIKRNAQLRELMQAKKAAKAATKITHKLAQYSAAGALQCKICRVQVQNTQAQWDKHLLTQDHKLKMLALQRLLAKKKAAAAAAAAVPAAAPPAPAASTAPAPVSGMPADFFESSTEVAAPATATNPALPAGFFDSAPPAATAPVSAPAPPSASPSPIISAAATAKPASSSPATAAVAATATAAATAVAPADTAGTAEDGEEEEDKDELPVGFFDDKKKDKEMRTQRDFTKELAAFRQIMVQTAKASREQQKESHLKLAALRQQAEVADQQQQVKALEELKRKTAERRAVLAEKKRQREEAETKEEDSDEGDSDSDEEDPLVFSWRSKKART